jgi:plastocyanin
MSIWGRRISIERVAIVAVILMVVVGVARVVTRGNVREITVVARDMAFYADRDEKTANPVIEVKAGETVRIILKNRDRGMTHDFAVPALGASTHAIDWNEEDEMTIYVPKKPGTYEYVCQPHVLMMKGTLKVIGD